MSNSTQETIGRFFERDHDEIDAILKAVDFADSMTALARFREFDRRLERHIVWEESILFPAAGRAAPPLEHGPIALMNQEHVHIRAAKMEALQALEAGDCGRAKSCVKVMLSILEPHNMKEEHILYPACDQMIGDVAAAEMLARIKSTV